MFSLFFAGSMDFLRDISTSLGTLARRTTGVCFQGHVSHLTQSGKWHCQCRGTKNRQSCVHRYISMWWIFQERPQLAQNAIETNAEEIEEMVMETEDTGDSNHSEKTCTSVITMTNYFWNSKRIPEQLPHDLSTTEKPLPERFEPQGKKVPILSWTISS